MKISPIGLPSGKSIRFLSTSLWLALFAFLCAIPTQGAGGRQTVRGHIPEVTKALQPVGRLPGTNRLKMAISLPLRNSDQLARLIQQISDPASPNYRHYLTPEQFTEQFGPSQADYQAVTAFAVGHGLTVTGTHPNRLLLDVTGAAADVEQAFHVKMQVYQHPTEGRTFYAPDSDPSLDLTTPVLDVSGLQNYSQPKPLYVIKPPANGQNALPNAGSGPEGNFLGKDFRAAYAPNTTMTGTGQTVGLLEFDGYYAADIANYESQAGLSSVTLSNVLLDGFTGAPEDPEAVVEVSLDIEMAISMAPGLSKVMVYEAGENGSWHDMLNRMADDNLAKQLSCSWYANEGPDPVAEQIFQQMAAQGQTFLAACGDYDAYTGSFPFPDDSPSITLVGGTTLTTSGPQGSWVSETVWNEGDGIGSGGGISTYYPIPSWQTNISMTANLGSTTMRNVPDVALTAYNVYVVADGEGQPGVAGTSCAAPLWAGFTALVNQQAALSGRPAVGFINPALDAIGTAQNYTSSFHDITTGNNTSSGSPHKFYAVTGYDLCTGWGVPNGQALITALGTPDPLGVQPNAGFTAEGGSGGPFTETAESFVLTNSGTNSLNWVVVNPSSWLTVSMTNGTLAGGGPSETTTVSLSTNAYTLPIGNYTATVAFSNVTTSNAQSRQFELEIVPSVPPTIVTQPTNQTIFQGYSAAFSVTASGTPPLNYQWQFDTTNIDGATNSVLELTNVGFSEAGSYSVIVSNPDGATNSSAAVLTVNPPPPCDPAPPGLISWWPAEGNANDEAGLNNASLINGASFGPGEVGQAFEFNGANQYVSVPDSPSLRPASLTVEGWVNFQNFSGVRMLFAKTYASSPWESWNVWYTGGQLWAVIVTPSGIQPYLTYTWAPAAGTWHHVAYTFDATAGQQTLYVDGVAVESSAASGPILYDSEPMQIGAGNNGGAITYFFDGEIDETSIYDQALTASEVASIYAASISGKCALSPTPPVIVTQPNNQTVYEGYNASFSVTANGTQPLDYQWSDNGTNIAYATNATLTLTNVGYSAAGSYTVTISNTIGTTNSAAAMLTVNPPPPCDPVPPGLISWWPAEGNANDEAGLNNASLINGVSFGPGEVGQAFEFNGVNQYVSVPDSPSLRPASLTVEGWVNFQSFSGVRMLFAKTYASSPWESWNVWYTSGQLWAVIVTPGGVQPYLTYTWAPAAGTWHHVAYTFDATAGQQTLYVDGAAVKSGAASGPILYGSEPMQIGAGNNGGAITYFFDGEIDETSIYNQALTASEVASIYSVGTNGKCEAPPNILIQPQGQIATVGESVTFSVTAGGASPLNYQWSDNGTDILNATSSSLILTNVQVTNDGGYAVTISNSIGVAISSNAMLAVGFAPSITNQPQSQEVDQGTNVSFTVGVSGTGPFDYQWYYESVALQQATNSILTLTNVEAVNSGSYRVTVTTLFGSVLSSNATLTVDVPPTIVTQPANETVYVGFSAAFSVTASGTAPLNYQWQFDTTNISGATNSSLSLTNVSFSEAGSYSVTVSNALGATNSSAAMLTVNPPPPCDPDPSGIVGWWPGNGNTDDIVGGDNGTAGGGLTYAPGEVGEAFSFSGGAYVVSPATSALNVGANSGLTVELWLDPSGVSDPQPLVEWNTGVTSGTEFLLSVGAPGVVSPGCISLDLVDTQGITHFLSSPAGLVAANAFQHIAATYDHTSGLATLYRNGVVVASENLGVFAPQTSYNLYFGDQPDSPNFYNGLMDEVSIYSRALSAAEVSNIYAAGITGKCPPTPTPPSIVTQPTNQTVYPGSTASFGVAATGTPPLDYQWSDNGTNISDATNLSLTLTNVSFGEAGSYSVTVSNALGATNSSAAVLTVNPPPPCDPVPPGLISWWSAEGNADDEAGLNDGSLLNGASFGPGEVGQAFEFNGANQYVSIPDSPSLRPASLTVEGWVNFQSLSGVRMLFAKTYASSPWESWNVWYASGQIWADVVTPGGVQPYLAYTWVPAAGTWHHVAYTFDATAGRQALYVDGAAVESGAASGPILYDSEPMQIGAGNNGGAITYFFDGEIDETSIYDQALTAPEVASIYAASFGGKCPPPPSIVLQPQGLTVAIGGAATFSVTAGGLQPLEYHWEYNGRNITNATNASLTIADVQITNAGSYSVIVSNYLGEATSSNAVLSILGAPVIYTQPANRTVPTQATATFVVDAWANPAPAYQWQINGVNVTGATNATLSIPNAEPADGGTYTVIISNNLGHVVSSDAVLLVNYITATAHGQAEQIATTNLTAPAAVQPGNIFAVSSVNSTSAQGAAVQLADGLITYTPPAGFTGEDSFSYVLTPASGLSFEQNVIVLVNDSLILGAMVSGGQATIQFAGLPETFYLIQASTNLINWTDIGGGTAGENGRFQFQDVNAGLYPVRYYRTVLP